MNSQLFSSSPRLSLLCFLLVILLKIQSSSINYDICRAQFECGNITAGYPFWGRHSGEPCGHPELKLDCEGDPDLHGLTTMNIDDVKYRVLDINLTSHALTIAILMSQSFHNCLEFPNSKTTFNSELFNYSGAYENVTLHYDCPPSEPGENCLANSVKYKDDFIPADGTGYEARGCHVNATVPVPKPFLPAAKVNWSDWEEILQQGFELKWKIGGSACEDCTNSKGNCGFNSISNETICYCPHNTAPPFYNGPCTVAGGSFFNRKESFFNRKEKICIGIAAAVMGIIIIITILIGASRIKHTLDKSPALQNKKANNDQIVEAFVRNINIRSFAPKKYSYSDVKKMTKSFSNKLGQGG